MIRQQTEYEYEGAQNVSAKPVSQTIEQLAYGRTFFLFAAVHQKIYECVFPTLQARDELQKRR
ncbi:MAG TPA: hypothetical protein VFK25_07655 [Candidatus Binatia bacterium]|nr:hypothetical protein [Candidatus Binatia bacterium]